MKFKIDASIFEKIPNLCAGIVVVKGFDNSKAYSEIDKLLDEAILKSNERFNGIKVKEDPAIIPYREAFRALDFNPNKFQCSAEALFTRISKGNSLPHINPLVDLNNAISLTYTLPMGTHDLGLSSDDIEMRPAVEGDTFISFGSSESEPVPAGEIVYAVGHDVRTRRWTWRQSEVGKINSDTKYVFFPIDGFVGFNEETVKKAAEELSNTLKSLGYQQILVGFVDKTMPSFDLTL